MDYWDKCNEEILKTKSGGIGLQISFKDKEGVKKSFLLNGKGESRCMWGLIYHFLNDIGEGTNITVQDLPTTGKIDEFNEKIKQLPKTQMDFWQAFSVLNPIQHLGEIDLRPDIMRQSMNFLGAVSCFIVYGYPHPLAPPYQAIVLTALWPALFVSIPGWCLLAGVHCVIVSSNIISYYFTGNL